MYVIIKTNTKLYAFDHGNWINHYLFLEILNRRIL
jgi:hypothetical protein